MMLKNDSEEDVSIEINIGENDSDLVERLKEIIKQTSQ